MWSLGILTKESPVSLNQTDHPLPGNGEHKS
jgi:hypothetical protein